MVTLTRREIRNLLRGLSSEREHLREEIANDPEWCTRLLEAPDYVEIINLQEKLISALDKMTY